MPVIDFQAQTGSSATAFHSWKSALGSSRSQQGPGSSSFFEKLQRPAVNRQPEQAEPERMSRIRGQSQKPDGTRVNDAGKDESRNTEAPGGTDALTLDQESAQLEVKDETNNTDIENSSTVQEAASTAVELDGEILGLIAEMIAALSQELKELENSLEKVISGLNPGDGSDQGFNGSSMMEVDDILSNIQELETAIQKLSQTLETVMQASVNGLVSEDLEVDLEQLKIMLNGGKLMIREHFKANGSEPARDESQGRKLLKLDSGPGAERSNAAENQGREGAPGQQDEKQDGSQIKRIMLMENSKLTMVKVQSSDRGTEEAEDVPGPNTVKSNTGDCLVVNNNLIKITMENGSKGAEKPLPVADPGEIVDQVVKKFELLTKQEGSEIKIQLKPEFLGKMTIKLSLEEGVLSAKFVTDNQQVKGLLESNLALFRQQLEAAGIKVDKAEVAFQMGGGTDYDSMAGNPQFQWQQGEAGNNGKTLAESVMTQGYSQYAGEELETEEGNPFYDDITGDSSVSYIV